MIHLDERFSFEKFTNNENAMNKKEKVKVMQRDMHAGNWP